MNDLNRMTAEELFDPHSEVVEITTYPKPMNEEARLEALYSLDILDTPREERFDRVARLAAAYFGTPMARITFVDRSRTWYKACVGPEATEGSRTHALCAHTVMSNDVFVSPDLSQDPRFSGYPQVSGDPKLRFYAAAPVVLDDGSRVGSVCVFDIEPRTVFSEQDGSFLRDLAQIVIQELKLHKQIASGRETIIDAGRQLAVAQGARDRFMGIVSHELKTPLTQILGFGRLLEGQHLGPLGCDDYLAFVRGICRSAEHLEGLIGRIISYTSAEAGELRLSETICDTQSIMAKCLDLMRLRENTSGVEISSLSSGDAPVAVFVDEVQLVEALVQILSNAIAFSPKSSSVEFQACCTPDGGVQFEVHDRGPGIHPDLIERLTEAFTQCDESLSRQHDGIGLGLAVARAIVELHGGGLLLSNREGGGASVVVSLPANRNRDRHHPVT